jgi:hypothetical protein
MRTMGHVDTDIPTRNLFERVSEALPVFEAHCSGPWDMGGQCMSSIDSVETNKAAAQSGIRARALSISRHRDRW